LWKYIVNSAGGGRESFGTDDDIFGKLCGLVEMFWRIAPKILNGGLSAALLPTRETAVPEWNFPARDGRDQ
jgi:hypothetical protein